MAWPVVAALRVGESQPARGLDGECPDGVGLLAAVTGLAGLRPDRDLCPGQRVLSWAKSFRWLALAVTIRCALSATIRTLSREPQHVLDQAQQWGKHAGISFDFAVILDLGEHDAGAGVVG